MITAPTGRFIPSIEPGSPEWLTRMSGSKIAAVLGLSPYESRFSLWHRMSGLSPAVDETDEMRRGHYLEPACAAYFADQHKGWQVAKTGTFVAADDDSLAATPDRLVTTDDGEARLLECKSDSEPDNWGTPGTDQVPVYYRAQAVWQMDITGLRVCHMSIITRYLQFAEYVVEYDADEAAFMRAEARAFMASLPGGPAEQRPDLDDHTATYQVVKELHPGINGDTFDVPLGLAREFCGAQLQLKEAKSAEQGVRTRLADAMGDAKKAMFGEKCIATRQVRGAGLPFLKASPNLPAIDTKDEAA